MSVVTFVVSHVVPVELAWVFVVVVVVLVVVVRVVVVVPVVDLRVGALVSWRLAFALGVGGFALALGAVVVVVLGELAFGP